MRHVARLGALLLPTLLSGCIVLDQVTTLTVRPDGSADLVLFHSNVRSTEEGRKAEDELRRHAEAFDARTSDDLTRITKAGGEVLEARWLRRAAPYATVIAARIPNATVLEKLATIEDDNGQVVVASRYSQEGPRRRLTMVVTPPQDFDASQFATPSPAETQRREANGLNATRVVVEGGRIVSSQGWTVADDRGSALLAWDEVQKLLRDSPKRVDLFIEWEVPATPARD